MNRRLALPILSVLVGTIPASGQPDVTEADQQSARDIDMQFAAAFNRQDAAGVASLFTEDGIRVTPQGIIRGRDAIQKDADKRFQSRFHDLSLTPTILRAGGNSIWEAGEWSMKIGNQPVHGYFSITLVPEGNKVKIKDDTFNVMPPVSGQQPASK